MTCVHDRATVLAWFYVNPKLYRRTIECLKCGRVWNEDVAAR